MDADQIAEAKYAFNINWDPCDDYAPGTAVGLKCIKRLFTDEGCKADGNPNAPNAANQASFDKSGSVDGIRA